MAAVTTLLIAVSVVYATFTGRLWVASTWTVAMLIYLASLAVHLKGEFWKTWAVTLGFLATLYSAYTVSYLALEFSGGEWDFADHMGFVGWTGPLALVDAPMLLVGVWAMGERAAKRDFDA